MWLIFRDGFLVKIAHDIALGPSMKATGKADDVYYLGRCRNIDGNVYEPMTRLLPDELEAMRAQD